MPFWECTHAAVCLCYLVAISVGFLPGRYNLTRFAIELNEITPGLREKLAPTDCRLRPDQHNLELGQYDQARALP